MTTVLVVDDEPQILRALRINLRVRQYDVHTAGSGSEALEIAARHPPDLVILDLGLPDLDGVQVIEGLRGLPFSAQGRCYPGGVPGQLLYPAEPFYFIQTPKEVWMVWQTDHMVRRIYMTDQHSKNVKPSWFGESIGHYEGNDTLVIDTIGLQANKSFLDWYRTPHTEKEHVVERFKLSADGKLLEALVTVEDPDTFNEPLYMVQRWRKVPNQRLEMVCAENNGDHFGKNLFPIPHADTPDF